jgi:HD-like signal output (HDOD) protein
VSEKARILFVDDEPHVLKGLRRLLLEWEDRWETSFCTSGAEALAELATHPADVVVSDMRMPRMDGAELLDAVRQRFPATIRVILSGYAETRSVMKTVGPAHIYLAKPCEPEALFRAIARPLGLRRMLGAPELQAVIGRIDNLPSLPATFTKIREELRSLKASPASVAAVLAQDVAMTAEILKLTNSSFFGLGARVNTPLQAVRTLGLETIQALVLEVGLFRQFSGSGVVGPVLEALNRHCLTLGRLAERMSMAAGWGEDTAKAAHCAGMLSFIGCLILLDNFPQPDDGAPDSGAAAYGALHHLVGAYLLGLWGFSDEVVEAVAFAAEPRRAPTGDNPILAAVHAAAALGPKPPIAPNGMDLFVKLDMAYLIEVRQDGNVRRWQALAEDHLRGE